MRPSWRRVTFSSIYQGLVGRRQDRCWQSRGGHVNSVPCLESLLVPLGWKMSARPPPQKTFASTNAHGRIILGPALPRATLCQAGFPRSRPKMGVRVPTARGEGRGFPHLAWSVIGWEPLWGPSTPRRSSSLCPGQAALEMEGHPRGCGQSMEAKFEAQCPKPTVARFIACHKGYLYVSTWLDHSIQR